MRIELANCQATLMEEIENTAMKRKDVALTYAMAMCATSEVKDWKAINAAIVARWSDSGLKYIKRLAWKIRDEKMP